MLRVHSLKVREGWLAYLREWMSYRLAAAAAAVHPDDVVARVSSRREARSAGAARVAEALAARRLVEAMKGRELADAEELAVEAGIASSLLRRINFALPYRDARGRSFLPISSGLAIELAGFVSVPRDAAPVGELVQTDGADQ